MDPITAVLAFLKAWPDTIKLIQEGMTFINHVSGGDPQGFIKDLGAAMAKLNSAESDEDRQAAAKAISDTLRGLG